MNNQEALDIFVSCATLDCEHCNMSFRGREDKSRFNEMRDMVISALEKQIPKKPEWNLQNDAILCPCCGLDLMGGVEIDSEIDPEHCWNCGQAIDWRNEDE